MKEAWLLRSISDRVVEVMEWKRIFSTALQMQTALKQNTSSNKNKD